MTPPAGYYQVFNDDFPGSSIDATIWTVSNGVASDGLGTFQSSVGVIAGSILTCSVTGSPDYFSWRMKSVKRFLYGYYEVKVRLPGSGYTGAWNSPVWLWNTDDVGNPNNNYQEIDVAEAHSTITTNYFNVIYRTNPSKLQTTQSVGANPYDGAWHTYAAWWLPGTIDFYIDDAHIGSQVSNPFVSVPNRPMNLVCDAKVGGFGGSPDGTTVFPLVSQVDYIAVYQLARQPGSYWG